jgi:hypothetical protein
MILPPQEHDNLLAGRDTVAFYGTRKFFIVFRKCTTGPYPDGI